jgi:hypothetical protein
MAPTAFRRANGLTNTGMRSPRRRFVPDAGKTAPSAAG